MYCFFYLESTEFNFDSMLAFVQFLRHTPTFSPKYQDRFACVKNINKLGNCHLDCGVCEVFLAVFIATKLLGEDPDSYPVAIYMFLG